MLTNVDVFGANESFPRLSLPLVGAENSPIQIKNIDGLGPVKANVNTAPYGFIPGEAITGTSIGKRNIVIALGLNPDWAIQTIEELRKQLYQYFMPGLRVGLEFTSTHLPGCFITGTVESMEPNMFSKDPEIQVSIICPRPEFIGFEEGLTEFEVEGVVGTPEEINYLGSMPNGLTLTVVPSPARGAYTGTLEIRVTNFLGVQSLFLDNLTIDNTRHLQMNSVPGLKFVKNPIGAQENLLGKVRTGYTWPVLVPGENTVFINADLPGQDWTLSYLLNFGGL